MCCMWVVSLLNLRALVHLSRSVLSCYWTITEMASLSACSYTKVCDLVFLNPLDLWIKRYQTNFEEFSWVLHRRISDHYITWVEPILLSGRRSSPGSPSRIPPILTPLSRILKALQHWHTYWLLSKTSQELRKRSPVSLYWRVTIL